MNLQVCFTPSEQKQVHLCLQWRVQRASKLENVPLGLSGDPGSVVSGRDQETLSLLNISRDTFGQAKHHCKVLRDLYSETQGKRVPGGGTSFMKLEVGKNRLAWVCSECLWAGLNLVKRVL